MILTKVATRLLVLLGIAGGAMLAGLLQEQWIDLREVDPLLAVDSDIVLARGAPHAWLVVQPQGGDVPRTTNRVASRRLIMSTCFWLALSTLALAASRATFRLKHAHPLEAPPTSVRAFAGAATGVAAATYAFLITGMASYLPLLGGTCLALLTALLLLRKPRDLSRWLVALLLLVLALLAVSSAFSLLSGPFVVILGAYLVASVCVGYSLLYWLTPTAPSGAAEPHEAPGCQARSGP